MIRLRRRSQRKVGPGLWQRFNVKDELAQKPTVSTGNRDADQTCACPRPGVAHEISVVVNVGRESRAVGAGELLAAAQGADELVCCNPPIDEPVSELFRVVLHAADATPLAPPRMPGAG